MTEERPSYLEIRNNLIQNGLWSPKKTVRPPDEELPPVNVDRTDVRIPVETNIPMAKIPIYRKFVLPRRN